MKIKIKLLLLMLFCFTVGITKADHQPQFSTAGFYELPNSGRTVYSMNPAWRFYKGSITGAEAINFDDSKWKVVSLPHGLEYLPVEASTIKVRHGIVSISSQIII